MRTINAQVPDYLAALAHQSAKEKTTVDQIIALALSVPLSAWKVRRDLDSWISATSGNCKRPERETDARIHSHTPQSC